MNESKIYKVLFKDEDSFCMHCEKFDKLSNAKYHYDILCETWDYVELIEEKHSFTSINRKGDLNGLLSNTRKECDYCTTQKSLGQYKFDVWIKNDDNKMVVEYDNSELSSHGEEEIEINYCPMCGRKL